MHYQVKSAVIEAERLLLSGQNLVAVAIDGKAHLLDGAVFDLFYQPKVDVEASKPLPVRPIPGKPAPKPVVARPAKPPYPGGSSGTPKGVKPVHRGQQLREKLLGLLAEGPLTTAEIGSHLYPEQANAKLRGQCAWLQTKNAADAGLIEKREHNGLDKWHLRS